MNDSVVLTREMVNSLRTPRGSFTAKTVQALGMEWGKMEQGWVQRLIGKSISRSRYEQALAGNKKKNTAQSNGNHLHGVSSPRGYILHTDGGCHRNGRPDALAAYSYIAQGPLGWERVGSGWFTSVHEKTATNNKAEFLGCIEGLKIIPEGSEVLVVSDSMILLNWIDRINRGKVFGKTAMCRILIGELGAEVLKRKVSTKWVQGHSVEDLNNECDKECERQIEEGLKALGRNEKFTGR